MEINVCSVAETFRYHAQTGKVFFCRPLGYNVRWYIFCPITKRLVAVQYQHAFKRFVRGLALTLYEFPSLGQLGQRKEEADPQSLHTA
jgi:hypothetical protein